MNERDKRHIRTVAKSIKSIAGNLTDEIPHLKVITKTFGIAFSACKQIKITNFVASLASQFEDTELVALEQKLLSSSASQEIGDILDTVLFSRSTTVQYILGIIAGKFLLHNVLDYEDQMLIGALRGILDSDLKLFREFYEQASISVDTCYKAKGLSPNCTDYVIAEKLISVGLFGSMTYASLTIEDVCKSYIKVKITPVSVRLNEYLSKIKNMQPEI